LCRHFGACGGCTLQDLSEDACLAEKRARIEKALRNVGLEAPIGEVIRVPPASRRRAAFAAKKAKGKVALGFRGSRSHAIVDMQQCLVLTHALFDLVAGLRAMMGELLADGGSAELHVTQVREGFDLAFRWSRRSDPALAAVVARWAQRLGFVRVTANGEILTSLGTPSVDLAGVSIALPPESFLQPTREGEKALQQLVSAAAGGAKNAVDLFAGCGTFTFVLAKKAKVHAVEGDRAMLEALAEAAGHAKGLKPVTTEKRDLHKHPLTARELARFDLAVLDPPRAGAASQARQLAGSTLERIVYVSCDAESFARDARTLTDANFRLRALTPMDQFLWSEHIELVGIFER